MHRGRRRRGAPQRPPLALRHLASAPLLQAGGGERRRRGGVYEPSVGCSSRGGRSPETAALLQALGGGARGGAEVAAGPRRGPHGAAGRAPPCARRGGPPSSRGPRQKACRCPPASSAPASRPLLQDSAAAPEQGCCAPPCRPLLRLLQRPRGAPTATTDDAGLPWVVSVPGVIDEEGGAGVQRAHGRGQHAAAPHPGGPARQRPRLATSRCCCPCARRRPPRTAAPRGPQSEEAGVLEVAAAARAAYGVTAPRRPAPRRTSR